MAEKLELLLNAALEATPQEREKSGILNVGFNIEEKTYIYQDITQKIRERMTPGLLDAICRGCEWYPVSACKRVLCSVYTQKKNPGKKFGTGHF